MIASMKAAIFNYQCDQMQNCEGGCETIYIAQREIELLTLRPIRLWCLAMHQRQSAAMTIRLPVMFPFGCRGWRHVITAVVTSSGAVLTRTLRGADPGATGGGRKA